MFIASFVLDSFHFRSCISSLLLYKFSYNAIIKVHVVSYSMTVLASRLQYVVSYISSGIRESHRLVSPVLVCIVTAFSGLYFGVQKYQAMDQGVVGGPFPLCVCCLDIKGKSDAVVSWERGDNRYLVVP